MQQNIPNLLVIKNKIHGRHTFPSIEHIVVSSQWCEDTCLVSNYSACVTRACDVPGASVPYHPPSVLDVLSAARMKMLCFELSNRIDGRLVTAVTGQVYLFSVGSRGPS